MEFLSELIIFLSGYIDTSDIKEEAYTPYTQEEIVESNRLIDEEYTETIDFLDSLIKE